MSKTEIKIEDFSEHLFWDVDKTKLNLEKNKTFFVQRVLEYGVMNDWVLILSYYGREKLGIIATEIRDLEPKSLSFISTISKIPIEKFRCYNTKQLIPQHWNF
ncbi:MAG: hypothetical protein JXL97_20130 [Bacteroidales bacterium]|nr:hypothetical protein [Bacteroidales bacterium]